MVIQEKFTPKTKSELLLQKKMAITKEILKMEDNNASVNMEKMQSLCT